MFPADDCASPPPVSPPMSRALALAAQALHRSAPNPRVGCVLCDAQGAILGEGATQMVGGAHAEIMALRDAAAKGHDTQGASAYVTLEPCAHFGRTGPCCDALIAAGIHKVVAALQDPNPRVAGQGFARLRAADLVVEVGDGAAQAWEMNLGFFSRMLRARPWVRAKVAASLDGITALPNGKSQWITAAPARDDGHAWRARACVILTGSGTVLADNPRLDVRAIATQRQPAVAIIDSRLQTPPEAALFTTVQRQIYIYTTPAHAQSSKAQALRARGAQLVPLPGVQGQVDLSAVLADMAARLHINEVHVEAGQRLNAALLRCNLVDEWLCYLAPKLLWQGAGWAAMAPLHQLHEASVLQFQSVQPVGSDLRLLLRQPGASGFGACTTARAQRA